MGKVSLRVAGIVVLIAVLAAFAAIIHLNIFSAYSSAQNRPIGAGVTVSGSKVPNGMKASVVSSRQTLPAALLPLGSTIQITPGGTLPAPVTLRFKLDKQVTSSDAVLLETSESASGPWKLVRATISSDGWYATVTTPHLSWWRSLWYNVQDAISQFTKEVASQLTGDLTTEAEPPH
ncbi:MAG: hypothetical protein KGO05_10780, partial [Chloroflexota bacterium]|nr:hypothetical protein [Chloroflexota bacterium]